MCILGSVLVIEETTKTWMTLYVMLTYGDTYHSLNNYYYTIDPWIIKLDTEPIFFATKKSSVLSEFRL